jgi:hypothetical protein
VKIEFKARPVEILHDPEHGPSLANRAAKAILLIRILVGWVFLSEAIQKFLFPEALGVGRFLKMGIPLPLLMAPFVGVAEIICGGARLSGSVYSPCLRASPYRHLRRFAQPRLSRS